MSIVHTLLLQGNFQTNFIETFLRYLGACPGPKNLLKTRSIVKYTVYTAHNQLTPDNQCNVSALEISYKKGVFCASAYLVMPIHAHSGMLPTGLCPPALILPLDSP